LIRRESLLLPPAEQDTPGYEIQRFVLEAQGPAADLMRFLAQVGSPPYPTFILHNINITQNDPAVAEADLTVYSSDLEVGSPLPENETEGTPVPEGQEGDRIQEFEMLMRRAVAQENWAEAISYGQRILRLEAGNENAQETLYQAYVSWGDELAAEGNVVQARQQYENALELRPDGEEALEGLRALEDQGPNDAARADVPSGQGRAEGASG
jgi:tetratricopeptide (TPR) repeat protein